MTTLVLNPADVVVSLADGYYYGERRPRRLRGSGRHAWRVRRRQHDFISDVVAFSAPPVSRYDTLLGTINRSVPWTPHVRWVDYTWLERYAAARSLADGRLSDPHLPLPAWLLA